MGYSPQSFFETTPRLYDLAAEGHARRRDRDFRLVGWQVHTTAILERRARIPSLEQLVSGPDVKPRKIGGQTADAMLAIARQWQAVLGKGGNA